MRSVPRAPARHLTVGWTLPAWACGAIALVTLLRWLWQLDRAPQPTHGAIGASVVVPVRAHGRGTPAWCGTLVLVVAHATVSASMLFERAEAWSATVGALLGLQGVHAVLLLLMGGWPIARVAARLLRPDAHASIHCCALLWHWSTLQGLVLIAVVTGLPARARHARGAARADRDRVNEGPLPS